MKIESEWEIVGSPDGAELHLKTIVNGRDVTSAMIAFGTAENVQDFATGAIGWDELADRNDAERNPFTVIDSEDNECHGTVLARCFAEVSDTTSGSFGWSEVGTATRVLRSLGHLPHGDFLWGKHFAKFQRGAPAGCSLVKNQHSMEAIRALAIDHLKNSVFSPWCEETS